MFFELCVEYVVVQSHICVYAYVRCAHKYEHVFLPIFQMPIHAYSQLCTSVLVLHMCHYSPHEMSVCIDLPAYSPYILPNYHTSYLVSGLWFVSVDVTPNIYELLDVVSVYGTLEQPHRCRTDGHHSGVRGS